MRRTPRCLVPALLCLSLALVGCGAKEDTAARRAREGYLIINNAAEPSGLDPQEVTGLLESRIVYSLFEGLVNYKADDLSPIPGAAESWTNSADGRTWTFRIRPAARWSNGDPVTARDFLFSYQRMLLPTFGSEYASMLHCVRGAKAFNEGKLKDFAQVGFRAPDDMTLVSGTIEAKGRSGTGGRIEVLGNKVGVMDGATIDASGETGGGTVLIGGDFQGKNPDIQNAQVTWFGQGARLNANAVTAGDGGKIIVWADDTTRAYGNISARGGAISGNGGFVEVSGNRYLDFQAQTDRSAANGLSGTLLLDPMDINISDTADSFGSGANFGGTPNIFQSGSVSSFSQISWSTIQSQLNAGNVIISTKDAGGTGQGNITISSSYGGGASMNITHNWESGSTTNTYSNLLNSGNSLTLLAENNININASFGNAGTGEIRLIAGWDGVDATTQTLKPFGSGIGSIVVTPPFFGPHTIVASKGSQTWKAPQLIQFNSNAYGGSGIDIDTGTLNLTTNKLELIGPTSPGFLGQGFRRVFISSNGPQVFNITDTNGWIKLQAGNTFGAAYGDEAIISQHGTGGSQTFNFYGGADLTLQAGGSSGGTYFCYGH